MLARTVCTAGIILMLASSNYPVLDALGILYIQTALVLLGAYFRPRINNPAARSRREIPLVELAINVRINGFLDMHLSFIATPKCY